MVDAAIFDGRLDADELAKRHHGLSQAFAQAQREEVDRGQAKCPRHVEDDVDVLLFARHVEEADRRPADGHAQRAAMVSALMP